MIEAKEGIMENYINWCMKSKKNKFKKPTQNPWDLFKRKEEFNRM